MPDYDHDFDYDMPSQGKCHGCGGEAVKDHLCESCLEKVEQEDSFHTPDDNLCGECGSTGEVDGRVCKNCQGKGYVSK
jgi:predicted amidophosphoribosyltransferase